MKQFKYYTSGVMYRVETKPDGTFGTPEVLKKWTTETYEPKKKPKTTKKKNSTASSEQEVW